MPRRDEALEAERAAGRGWGAVRPVRLDAVLAEQPRSVLDVGCSAGGYVAALADQGVATVGVDRLTDDAWASIAAPFIRADATALPVRSHSFDTVVAFETLEHVPDPLDALVEWRRVARCGLVVSVPDTTPLPWGPTAGLAHHHFVDRTHVNFFTEGTLVSLVEEAGFAVASVSPILLVNPFVPALDALGLPRRVVLGLGRRMTRLARRRYGTSLLLVATAG